jgi:hypothetical protein
MAWECWGVWTRAEPNFAQTAFCEVTSCLQPSLPRGLVTLAVTLGRR